jgi:putative inorganic carbon (HCO3(-)) transporter
VNPRDWPLRVPATAILLLVPVLLLLLGAEVRYGGTTPIALPVAGLVMYFALCLVDLPAAFLLLLVVTPFSVQRVFGGSGLQVPTEPMLFVALGVWFLRSLARGHHVIPQPAFLLALLLALASCLVSIIDTDFRFAGLKATLNVSWYALFGVFVLNNFGERGRLLALIHAWIWPSLAIVAWSAWNVLNGNYNRWAGYFWGEPFFYDHGTFSAYLSFTCALCLALTLELERPTRYLFLVVAAITGGQVVLSLTRGAWLGLAGLAPFLALAYGRRLLKPSNVAILVGGVSMVALLIMATGTERDIQKHSGTITKVGYQSNVERMNRWYAGYEMFRSDPIDGIGYGAYQDYYLNFRRLALATDQSRQRMGVHSEYLRVLAETGLLGAAAATLCLGLLVTLAWRAIRGAAGPLRRAMAVGMAGGLITYLIHAAVNNYLEYDKAAIPVWTAIGVLLAIERTNRRPA